MTNAHTFNKFQISKWVLVWLAAASIGIYFRLFPVLHHIPQEIREKASLLVVTKLRMQVEKDLALNYSQLSPQEKDVAKSRLFNEQLHRQRDKVRRQIDEVAAEMNKAEKVAGSRPYLLEADPFYYYGLTKSIMEKGHYAETRKGSKYLNKKMLAPNGHWEPYTLHPFVGYGTYKIVKLFNPAADLMEGVSWTPIALTIFSLVPFLLLLASMGVRPLFGFIAAVFYLLAPIFIKRSTFGWYDNDPYNLLFPFLLIYIFFQGLQKINNTRSVVATAVILGLVTGLYAYFWQGWMLIFSLILGALILIIVVNTFITKERLLLRPLAIYLGTYAGISLLAITVTFGFSEFFVLFAEGFKALTNFMAPQLSLWPDMFIGVGELNKSSLSFIVEQLGGPWFVGIALLGILFITVYPAVTKKNPAAVSNLQAITLLLILLVAFILTRGAKRFALFCLIPMSLLFALGLEGFMALIEISLKNIARQWQTAVRGVLLCCLLGLIILPARYIQQSINDILNPIYNPVWDNVMARIREGTPENSIINSWWPPGHFIKAMGERSVTVDGATINVPQAYWMANVFLSPSENHALGLLRMLNTSGNAAPAYLQASGFPLSAVNFMVNDIVADSRHQAEGKLASILNNPNAVHNILSLTHGKPPPSYILVYNDFVEKNLQLSFIGRWNFRAIEEINKDPKKISQIPPRHSPEYISFLWALVGGPYKYSGALSQISQIGDTWIFQEKVEINKITKNAEIKSEKYGKGIPYSIFYIEDDVVIEKKFPNNTLAYSIVLFKKKNYYECVLMDRPLAQSLLTRLYFFKGKGLKHIKPFAAESDLTNRTQVSVFEIDWDGLINDLENQEP